MRLLPHPDTPPHAIDSIEVDMRREGGVLVIDYTAHGRTDALALAPAAWPDRTDGLWTTTCFEAFLRAPGADAYREFNFAPSGRWAAYQFAGRRAGMTPLAMETPRLVATRRAESLRLVASIAAAAAPSGPLEIALTAVIDERDGPKSYWSLRHAPGSPDFHHPGGFVAAIDDGAASAARLKEDF